MTPSAVAAAVLRNNGSVALQLNVMLQYVVTNPAVTIDCNLLAWWQCLARDSHWLMENETLDFACGVAQPLYPWLSVATTLGVAIPC